MVIKTLAYLHHHFEYRVVIFFVFRLKVSNKEKNDTIDVVGTLFQPRNVKTVSSISDGNTEQ
jgi:hypothetical protein